MHKAHPEGQHLQGAPNLQVAKALRQCCQLIVVQAPATVTAPPPISVTCQHSPPRRNPCTPLQHHCTMHAQGTHRGAALTGRPQPSGRQSAQAALPADCRTSTCNRHRTTANQRHMPALCTSMQSLHTPSASLHHPCTSTHRGAALTGCPQPSGCQSSQAVLPADCWASSCNQHRTTANQCHMPALPTSMQSLHTPSASLHHPCTKHTQRGSTYRLPPTFRSPKLSGSVAS